MRLAFVAPSTAHPSGGVAVVYEMAAAMARRGHDVDLYHVNHLEGSALAVDVRICVGRFDWDRTGALLDAFLGRYVAYPPRYDYGLRAAAT